MLQGREHGFSLASLDQCTQDSSSSIVTKALYSLTNYKEGVLFVQWTVFSDCGSQQSAQTTSDNSLTRAVEYPVENLHERLEIAEWELRRGGHYVFLDVSQETLWVFNLSGPASKNWGQNDEREDSSVILSRSGLKSKCV